ncbi:hypothetical protein EJ07DRAFT_135856 [Lizonia empirigonia]|nr:hypothetical protein EJ07DRAFT_135856 [Lizonia empirigonia]
MASGHTLVRRFTDEQDGKTTLERATKAAQEEQDAIWEQEQKDRLSTYFETPDSNKRQATEAARAALQKTCEEFFKVEKPSGLAKVFRLGRKSSRTAVNEVMQQYVASNIEELRDVVEGLEAKWQEKQTKAFGYLRRLCSALHAHKKALALLPSQNNYASTLCGGLTLLISAAVNYDEIAETLSERITSIAVKASIVAGFVEILETQKMCDLYAELHAQLFLFYRDAIAWYLERKRERFWKSFNEQIKTAYEKAAENINDCINALLVQGQVAETAMSKTILLGVRGLERELVRQRQQPRIHSDLALPGVPMQNLLHAMVYSKIVGLANRKLQDKKGIPALEPEGRMGMTISVNRATALEHSTRLKQFVVGDEGQSFFKDGRFWLPHSAELATNKSSPNQWMDANKRSTRLWINSQAAQQEFPSSRAAALTSLVAAWQSEEPVISHFCKRPQLSSRPTDGNAEEIGLIGLVYSLVIQLLQFHTEDDAFEVSREQMESLDGSKSSWPTALRMFSDLLQATPQLSVCVVDDLNVLALSAGMRWCASFLDVLFEHQRACAHGFRILLTTAGYSRVVPGYFDGDSRVFVQRGAQEILRRGNRTIGPSSTPE